MATLQTASLQTTLDFLKDLAQNNNKAWFTENRKRYEQAQSAVEGLIGDLISALDPLDHFGTLLPKECLFRIYRDVRFAKDKSPYNSHMSAEIRRGGRHGQGRGYYLHIAPDNGSFFACGMYDPGKTALDNLRQHIALDAQPLRQIAAAPDFTHYFGKIEGEQLKTAPSGYDRANPGIDLLRYKQFLAMYRLSDAELVNKKLVANLVAARNAVQPFLDYLETASTAAPER